MGRQKSYIARALGIPDDEEVVQCPFNALDALAQSMLAACEDARREVRPVRQLVKLQQ
jgi:hypothetical protein